MLRTINPGKHFGPASYTRQTESPGRGADVCTRAHNGSRDQPMLARHQIVLVRMLDITIMVLYNHKNAKFVPHTPG